MIDRHAGDDAVYVRLSHAGAVDPELLPELRSREIGTAGRQREGGQGRLRSRAGEERRGAARGLRAGRPASACICPYFEMFLYINRLPILMRIGISLIGKKIFDSGTCRCTGLVLRCGDGARLRPAYNRSLLPGPAPGFGRPRVRRGFGAGTASGLLACAGRRSSSCCMRRKQGMVASGASSLFSA